MTAFFCMDKSRFGSSDCDTQCRACADKPNTEALLNFVEAVGDLLGVPKQPRAGYTALILSKLQLLTAITSVQSEIARSERHVHRCMSCGDLWYCPHPPSDCKAGENAFPSITLRGPNGPTVFHHACKRGAPDHEEK